MGFETQNVDRKLIAILRVIKDAQGPLGARIIARKLNEYGVDLGERAVRYHLHQMDKRGLTRLAGPLDGRALTEKGLQEINSALVNDKVGFAISRIELLAFRTDFNHKKLSGLVPVNVSFFPRDKFAKAIQAMRPVFEKGFCISDLVAVAEAGKKLGELIVPDGAIGLATVCSVVVNGTLLKAGIPMDSRFGGILQMRAEVPLRFVELIHYSGTSLDPSEIFIRAGMTAVQGAVAKGEGKILANFREIPALCRPVAEQVFTGLKRAGIGGLLVVGDTSEPVCEVPVYLNRTGIILLGGLNPVAAAQEAGIVAENHTMGTMMEYQELIKFTEVMN